MSAYISCDRCGGCGDFECNGCGATRWCNATTSGGGCDACHKPVERAVSGLTETVHCVANRHHSGEHVPGTRRIEQPAPAASSSPRPPEPTADLPRRTAVVTFRIHL